MHIITIYYRIHDLSAIRKIQEYFKFPRAMTVNGTWPVMVADEDWELLLETERRGYVRIRYNINIGRMKATKLFIDTITVFLTKEAEADPEFAKKMQEQPKKTPEAVCDYIMAEVSKEKRSGWADEEIYGMARHFIDEKDLTLADPNKNSVTRVVVNTHVDLSEEEKAEAKEEAVKRYQKEVERKADEDARRKAEREKAQEEKRRKEMEAKREKEKAMQGDLFGW